MKKKIQFVLKLIGSNIRNNINRKKDQTNMKWDLFATLVINLFESMPSEHTALAHCLSPPPPFTPTIIYLGVTLTYAPESKLHSSKEGGYAKISAGANGDPRSRVCARLTLRSAPHRH